jgi:tetratricopeptide (TPR) repeat protein
MPSLSVIVTTCNCEPFIGRTLRSLEAAVAFCRGAPGGQQAQEPEVLLVDDGSSDRTPQVIEEFIQGRASWRLLRRDAPTSPSCARNTGVREAQGEILCFLDGDDLYLPDHLVVCCHALAGGADFVKTGVRLADPVHPDWRPRIEGSLVLNLALRRRCHDFVGGFPDDHVFRRTAAGFAHARDIFYKLEDQFYNALVCRFFRGGLVTKETVEYCRHPGNSYDRQYKKFQRPFGTCPGTTDEDVPRLRLAEALIRNRIEELARGASNGHAADAAVLSVSPGRGPSPRAWAEASFRQGCQLAEQGRRDDSLAWFREAVALDPGHAGARLRLGIALAECGKRPEAIGHLRAAAAATPGDAQASYNLGVALAEEGRKGEAAEQFQEAIRREPAYAVAHYALGNLRGGERRSEEAVACYREAVRLKPDYSEAHNNLGLALLDNGRAGEAAVILRQAVRLRPKAPEAHNNLGLALAALGRFQEAEAAYEEALRLNPRYAEAENNLASALKDQGRHEEALAAYDLALALDPRSASTRWNRSLLYLQLGDFARGWPEYEWRWQRDKASPRRLPKPAWDGTPLEGRTILLYMEQGLGDMIQFLRYAPLVHERGGTVLVECPASLIPLFSTCPGIDRLVDEGDELPPFDVYAPLLSLPHLLGTTLETIPADVPYLAPDPARVASWGPVLDGIPGYKVGIAWQGNPRHPWDRHRSIPLAAFAPLARVPGVTLVSLQKGPGAEQARAVRRQVPVAELPGEVDAGAAFADTAAILRHLDLVITADTAVAHLAGAVGVPVWVALSAITDWRWLIGRKDSPWYPTMRLVRQERLGDWSGVFRRMAAALRTRAAGRVPTAG